jgi:hypothetical protein
MSQAFAQRLQGRGEFATGQLSLDLINHPLVTS